MLIQNAPNVASAPPVAPAPQAARPASDSASVAVASSSPEVDTRSDVKAEASRAGLQQAVESKSPPQPSAEQLRNAVDSINKALKQANRNLEFSVDKDTNRQVVKLVDSETGDVIRQFPSDEMLAISRAIGKAQEEMLVTLETGGARGQAQQGLLLKQEA